MGACCDNALVIENGWNVDDLKSSPSFAPYISGSTLNVSDQIKVEGSFTVDEDFSIENANMVQSSMYYYHILVNGKIKKADKLIIL